MCDPPFENDFRIARDTYNFLKKLYIPQLTVIKKALRGFSNKN